MARIYFDGGAHIDFDDVIHSIDTAIRNEYERRLEDVRRDDVNKMKRAVQITIDEMRKRDLDILVAMVKNNR
jgi:hypothetical protein